MHGGGGLSQLGRALVWAPSTKFWTAAALLLRTKQSFLSDGRHPA